MYPLKDWKKIKNGYTFGQPTYYNNFHLGIDKMCPVGTPVFAPSAGEVIWRYQGAEGGDTVWFRPDKADVVMRFLHLSEFGKNGRVAQGDIIGKTGNSGEMITGKVIHTYEPHLHFDISKKRVVLNDPKNFIDPDSYEFLQKIIVSFYVVELPFWNLIQAEILKAADFYANAGIDLHWVKIDISLMTRLMEMYDHVVSMTQHLPGPPPQVYIYRYLDFDYLQRFCVTGRICAFLYNPRGIEGLANMTLKRGYWFGLCPKTMVQLPVQKYFIGLKPVGLLECLNHELAHAVFAFKEKRETIDADVSRIPDEEGRQEYLRKILLTLS